MKKFLKAVALVTVMCMLLSVSAFAADSVATGDKASKTIDITIATGATAAEQVAVLIVDSAVTDLAAVKDEQIMYINQVTTDATGNATIEDVELLDSTTVVDVYIGSASLKNATLIGPDIDLNDVAKITIVTGTEIVKAAGTAEGGKHGYAAAISVDVPESLSVDSMIWAFKVADDWRYSTSIANPTSGAVSGGVQFAAAFNAYTENAGEFTEVEVTDVAAIFLTSDDAETVLGTDEDLLKDKKTVSGN